MRDPRLWERIQAILDAALERPIAERRAFVRERAATEAELAAEIDALLAESDAMGDFLEPDGADRRIKFALVPLDDRGVILAIAVLRPRA